MLFREVDRKLDMSLTISTKIQSSLISVVERDYGKLPVYIHIADGKALMDIFLTIDKTEKFGLRSNAYESIIREPYQILRIKMNDIPGNELLRDDIMSIPSLIISYLYIERGRIYGRMRFHHSDLPSVNKLIEKVVSSDATTLVDMGPGSGGIWEINELNRFLPLSVITYDQDLPEEWKFTVALDIFTELKSQRSTKGSYNLIFYGSNGMEQIPGKIISKESNISEISGTSEIANELWHESSSRFVSRIAVFGKQAEGKARTTIILPRILAQDQLVILSNIGRKYYDKGFKITAFRDYSYDIWQWV